MRHKTFLSLGLILTVLATFLTACSTDSLTGASSVSTSTPSAQRPTAVLQNTPGAYAQPDLLVNADWLSAHLGDTAVRVIALASKSDYLNGHIPGAAQIDWPDLQVTDSSNQSIANWEGEVEGKLGALGIAPGDTVVIYDGGSLFAARLWWVLDQLGHQDKRLLNGGFAAWQRSGGTVVTDDPRVKETKYQGRPDTRRLASWQYVLDHLDDPQMRIVDARSAEEYRGEDKRGALRGGHIPGAVNLNYVENAAADEPRYFKSQDDLRRLYERLGITKDKEVITYCFTGVRASVTYFTLKLIGYENVRLYPGSWAEWGNREDLPIEK